MTIVKLTWCSCGAKLPERRFLAQGPMKGEESYRPVFFLVLVPDVLLQQLLQRPTRPVHALPRTSAVARQYAKLSRPHV